METLDCGHVPSEHSSFTTGYGTDDEGKTSCYACCLVSDLAYMATTDTMGAYLSMDGATITNWPGGTLARVTWLSITKGYTPTGGAYDRVYVNARDADGGTWHGRGQGKGMCVVLRRNKEGK